MQEEMRYESSPAKAPPPSRRRTMPHSSLMEPEEAEVSLRYNLKRAKRRGSGIFGIFDTKEKRTILWQAGGIGWSTKERG